MPLSSQQSGYTAEEYLALERKAEYKSEYVNGTIVALAGVTRSHSLIVFNLARVLGPQLVGRTC
ncbi:MAG: Uma2 family endonuclease [Pseudomonadota bacterium]